MSRRTEPKTLEIGEEHAHEGSADDLGKQLEPGDGDEPADPSDPVPVPVETIVGPRNLTFDTIAAVQGEEAARAALGMLE